MKTLFTLTLMLLGAVAFGQFAIGSRTITYNDPTRTGGVGSGGGPGRQIECAVYYPATSAGANTPVAVGEFPVVVFGHGFAMQWSAYQNVWEHLTPKGFILVFPKTESSLAPAPSHNDFGLDLVVASDRTLLLNAVESSPFYQKINGKSAIMGHSMGGGATILAAENNTNIKTVIGLAPAETNPSAIAVAPNVTVPALILSGSSDGVTPPAEHHLPIYNGISASCKHFVSLTGGAHCYFANSNLACDFGESTASSGITLSRSQQQNLMNSLITPWLTFYLKGDCAAFSQFQTTSAASGLVTTTSCDYTPLSYELNITEPTVGQNNGSVLITTSGGQFPVDITWFNGSTNPFLSDLGPGSYDFTVTDAFCSMNGVAVLTTANLQDKTLEEIRVAPNPSSGIIQVLGDFTLKTSLDISDLSGRVIYTATSLEGNEISVDLSTVNAGVYLLRLYRETGASITHKIVIN